METIADRTIEIIIDVNDRTKGKVAGLQEQLDALDKKARSLANRFKAFSTLKYRATLELIDRVTAPASRMNNLLKRLANRAWRISFTVADSALAGIKKIESALLKITSKGWNVALNLKGMAGNKFNNLLSGAALASGVMMPFGAMAGVGFGFANAVQSFADFEKTMSKVQAIRQLSKTSDEMKALTAQAKELGKTTAWTRTQVAEAQYYQALAGWKTPTILAATPHMLNLASAGGTDLKSTSDIVTDAMTAFGINPTETYRNKQGQLVNATEHFIDMFAKIQASSNTDILQAGEAFKYGAPIVGAMFNGKDIQTRMQAVEDAMIMTGLMANAGIKGSSSGTGIKEIFNRIASMNMNAERALKLMHVDYKDDNGDMLMPGEIMRSLSKRVKEGVDPNQLLTFAEEIAGEKIHAQTRRKLNSFIEQTVKNNGKIGSADLMKVLGMIGGSEHMGKLSAVLLGDWDAMAKNLDNVKGTASGMAGTMLDNLAGSFTKLGSAWDNFQQNLMESPSGGLRDFVDALTEIINRADTLFKDGVQFGDIFALIGDGLSRLKNKFLEFDGVGSLLAGGALMAALTKIGLTARNVATSLRGLTRTPSAVNAGQRIGSMNVSAGVVNVNGRLSGGVGGRKVGNQAIIDNYYRTRQNFGQGTPPPATNYFAGAKSAAGGAAAFSAVFGLMDVMNVKAMNAERLANAAPEERTQILKENRQAEWEAGGGMAGSVIGSALGAALGSFAGPIGTMIGGVAGGLIGDYLGRFLGKEGAQHESPATENYYGQKSSVREKMFEGLGMTIPTDDRAERRQLGIARAWNETAKQIKSSADNAEFFNRVNEKHGALSPFANLDSQLAAQEYYRQKATEVPAAPDIFSHAEAGTPTAEQLLTEGQVPVELPPVDTSSWLEDIQTQISEGLSNIPATVSETFSSIPETAGTAFSSLGEIASAALESVTTAFTTSKETSMTAWDEVPGTFGGILSGLGSAAAAAGSAIYSGLTSVIGSIIGEWASGASTIMGIISSISSAAASAGASAGAKISGVIAGVRGHAEGGFITSPELALIGEAGPELVLPLNDPQRTDDLLNQAGLNSGVQVNATFNVNVNSLQEAQAQTEEQIQEFVEKISATLSEKLSDSFYNRCVT